MSDNGRFKFGKVIVFLKFHCLHIISDVALKAILILQSEQVSRKYEANRFCSIQKEG